MGIGMLDFIFLRVDFNSMKIIKAGIKDYSKIMEIWEASVKATHDFLKQEDFELFKNLIPNEFLPQLNVFVMEDEGIIPAFFAVSDDNLEMLFVDAESRGKGFGKFAVDYIINILKIYKVDVNKQNTEAVDFYLKQGYQRIGYSETDGMGKPYPLLYLEYSK